MGRIEKTVFLSYRRTNAPWALAISQNLTYHGYDVFFDFNGIASGDFESVILENIRARAHFIVLLTPSALERCGEPGDWLRREIETALEIKRNILPLMLESFDFGAPGIASQLTGTLAALQHYNALRVHADYFEEAMSRLREKYLRVTLDGVLHPASAAAQQAAKVEQAAASAAPVVTERELTAQEWFERGVNAGDLDEQIRFYSEAIRLEPHVPYTFFNRGTVRIAKGDLDGAIRDFDEAIRLKPDYVKAFNNRASARQAKSDLDGALQDCNEAIRLEPNYAIAFESRGEVRQAKGDLEGALNDFTEAIRLKPDFAVAYYNRALSWKQKDRPAAAIVDFQRFLDLGGGVGDGFKEKAEEWIRELKKKL